MACNSPFDLVCRVLYLRAIFLSELFYSLGISRNSLYFYRTCKLVIKLIKAYNFGSIKEKLYSVESW
jgi:hypothetical protein